MAKVLETTGMVCPFPLVEAKKAMAEIAVGEELIINFDCTQATESIPEWAAREGHEVTDFGTREELLVWQKHAEWNVILDDIISVLKEYLEKGKCADILKGKSGVGVGFVDGSIEVLYHK